jgi:hypothetical protein
MWAEGGVGEESKAAKAKQAAARERDSIVRPPELRFDLRNLFTMTRAYQQRRLNGYGVLAPVSVRDGPRPGP